MKKIVTSEIEGRETSDRNDSNSYAWEPNGTINYHDQNSTGKPFLAPGIVYGANYDSGDGNSRNTIKLIPDNDLINNGNSYNEDQYIIIDPTDPNHIHLRAGGTQDASSADLYLGAEYTNIRVSDSYRNVLINSKQQGQSMAHANINTETSEYLITTDVVSATNGWTVEVNNGTYYINTVQSDTPIAGQTTIYAPGAGFQPNGVYNVFSPVVLNMWEFNTDGFLYGPAEDALIQVAGIKGSSYSPIAILGPHSVVLDGNDGEFLNDSSNPDNQIAKIGDFETAYPETDYTVGGGTDGTQPAFTGNPLFFGSYTKTSNLVHFRVNVQMTNITNFGTGNYYITLPHNAKYDTYMRNGHLRHSSGDIYAISGHVTAGTNVLVLYSTASNGKEVRFTSSVPVGLNTTCDFHIFGSYFSA